MGKLIKNNLGNFLIICLIFLTLAGWIFSGWPQIWQDPSIPPEIKESRAESPEGFAYTGSTQYFYPADGIYEITAECWGGGGGGGKVNNQGGGGGGGGAYAKSIGITVAPGLGSMYAVTIGAGGTSEAAGSNSSYATTTVIALGGGAGSNADFGAGGLAADSTGNSTKSDGGDGGQGNSTGDVGGGGGGAGGPDGAGKTAANASANVSTAGGDGNNSNGTGYGGAAVDGGAGLPGDNDLTKGGGGGGGSENAQVGGAGGTPGGGGGGGGDNADGGIGGNGRCIVSYTDTWAPSVAQATYDNAWTFSTAPNNDADGQISMIATVGYDYNVISYSFTYTVCASDGGNGGTNSGWQSADNDYTDIGLDPNQCYGYTVQTKDSLENTGTVSAASETYSSANVPSAPTLDGATSNSLNLTNNENGNPSSNPITSFAAQVVTPGSDATWFEKWVDGSGNPSEVAVWLTDAELTALTMNSLQSDTTYGVKIQAKNGNEDVTLLSAEGQGATEAGGNQAPSITSVSLNGVANIVVNEGTWKSVTTTIAISDADYCDDISSVEATLYRADIVNTFPDCIPEDGDCYREEVACVATTTGDTCGASDETVEYDCGFHLWYIATPTDAGAAQSAQIWSVAATTTDTVSQTDDATNTGELIEVTSISALNETSTISYGLVIVGEDTGLINQETYITNSGNTAIDIEVDAVGTDMCDAWPACGGDNLAVTNQEFNYNSPFSWGSGTSLTDAVQEIESNLAKGTNTTTPDQTCSIFWGIGIPDGTALDTYTGQTNINAKLDD